MTKPKQRLLISLVLTLLITVVVLTLIRSTIVKSQSSAITLDGRLIFQANYNKNSVSVIDNATGRLITGIPVGVGPNSATLSLDGRRVYINNALSKNVSVIDVATNTVLYTYPAHR